MQPIGLRQSCSSPKVVDGEGPISLLEPTFRVLRRIPRLNFLLRTVYPQWLHKATVHFDKRVQETALSILQINPNSLTSAARIQLTLPIKLGGFGLRKSQLTSPLAFVSSFALVAKVIQKLFQNDVFTSPSHLSTFIPHCLSQIRSTVTGCDQLLPTDNDIQSVLRFYTSLEDKIPHLQKPLSSAMDKGLLSKLASQLDAAGIARLNSCKARYGGAWLTAWPTDFDSMLSSLHFRLAARFRLGIPPTDHMPLSCRCKKPLRFDPYHFLSCKITSLTAINFRHNMVVQAIKQWIRRAGGIALIEPTNLSLNYGKRPDLHIVLGTWQCLADVTVTHPCAPSNIGAALVELGLSRRAETQKNKRYRTMASAQGTHFLPVAAETFGAIGDSAYLLFSKIADYAEESTHGVIWQRNAVRLGLINAVAMAIQRGNAICITRGLHQAQYNRGAEEAESTD